MLLTNRRHRLLFMCLAAMDLAVALPYLAVLVTRWLWTAPEPAGPLTLLYTQPLAAFVLLWSAMLVYLLAADLLNRWQWPSPLRESAILILLLLTWLAAVRFLLHSGRPAADFGWLWATAGAVYDFTAGLRGELILLIANFVLWWRVTTYTDRDLSFFGVGLSFRLGMLLALLGNALLTLYAGQPQGTAIRYFVLFFAFGLAAVALARIDQKAVGAANSSGALLPWSRFAQLWATIVLVLGISLGLAAAYTPATLRAGLHYLGPVGRLLGWLLIQIIFLAFTLLMPALEAFARFLAGIIGEPVEPPPPEPAFGSDYMSFDQMVREWTALRYCLVTGVILLAAALLFIFFARTQLRIRPDEAEESGTEDLGIAPRSASLGLDRPRAWLNLLTRYGLSQRLLDAISAENIYANLVRLARRRGYPRTPSQPPDAYLPMLVQAFPHHDAPLARITAAYMRIHYGERPLAPGELDQLRHDYRLITAPPDPEDDSPAPEQKA